TTGVHRKFIGRDDNGRTSRQMRSPPGNSEESISLAMLRKRTLDAARSRERRERRKEGRRVFAIDLPNALVADGLIAARMLQRRHTGNAKEVEAALGRFLTVILTRLIARSRVTRDADNLSRDEKFGEMLRRENR